MQFNIETNIWSVSCVLLEHRKVISTHIEILTFKTSMSKKTKKQSISTF